MVVNLPLLLETVRGGVVPVEEAPLGTLGPLDLDQKALSIGLQSHEDAWKELPGAVKALQAQEIALVGVDVGDITLVAVSNDDLPPTLHGTEPALVQLQSPGVELPERDRNVDGLVGVSLVGFANELPDLLLKEGLALGSQGETDKLAEEGLPLLEALEALLEVPLPFPVGVDAEETGMFGKSVVDGEVCDLVVLGRSLPGDLVGPDLLGGEGGEKGDHRGLASFGGFREGVPLFHGPDQLDHVLVLDLHQLTLVDPEAVPEEEVTGFLKSLQKVLPKVLELLLRKGSLLLSRVFRFAEGSLLLFVQGTGPGHGDFLLLEKGEDSLELTLPFVIEFQEIHSQSGRTLFLDDSKNDGTVKLFRSVLRETEFVVFQIHKDQIPDGIPVLLFIDLDPL